MKTVQQIVDSYKDAIIQIDTQSGSGTGFYLKQYNLIITNHHVVEGKAEVTIAGKQFEKALSGFGIPIENMTWLFYNHLLTQNCPKFRLGNMQN